MQLSQIYATNHNFLIPLISSELAPILEYRKDEHTVNEYWLFFQQLILIADQQLFLITTPASFEEHDQFDLMINV